MNSSQQIIEGLERARAAVERAERALKADQDFDLRGIEAQVDLAAAAATEARQTGDGKSAQAMRALLINLVVDLDRLHASLKDERRQTADRLGRTSVGRRAFVAYGQRTAG